MRGVKSSLQRELDSFYKEVLDKDFNIRHVTKSGFSRSRSKLNPSAFVELNENVCTTFYDEAPYHVWHGMRVLASDGTRLTLPRHESVVAQFGEHSFGPHADSPRSLAMASFLYDTLNLITLDAQLAPYASSERELLSAHLSKLEKGDLLLLDRGYPSLALIFELQARGIQFCMRMKQDWWLDVKSFTQSGEKERLVEFTLPSKDHHLLETYPNLGPKCTCRLICVELSNGETEILCTSLVEEKYTHDDITELYHHRWGIEENYKLFKARAEAEYFSGKTARAVQQDFHAKVFMMTFCAVLSFPIEERVKKEYNDQQGRYHQKINRTAALSMTGNISIALFLTNKIKSAMEAFDKIVAQTRELIRPNRKFERKKKPKKPHHMNYKRI